MRNLKGLDRMWVLPPCASMAFSSAEVVVGAIKLLREQTMVIHENMQDHTYAVSNAVEKEFHFVFDPKSQHLALEIPENYRMSTFLSIVADLFVSKAGVSGFEVGNISINAVTRELDITQLKGLQIKSARFKLVAPNSPDHGAIAKLRKTMTDDRVLKATIFLKGDNMLPEGLIDEGLEMASDAYAEYDIRAYDPNTGTSIRFRSDQVVESTQEQVDDGGEDDAESRLARSMIQRLFGWLRKGLE